MKKFTVLLAAMLVSVLPMTAQNVDDSAAESSAEFANDSALIYELDDYDAIKLSYTPNRFADNWEISLSGGVSLLFNGIGNSPGTTSAPETSTGYKTYDAIGGVGEISATKWFNPYIAGRIGWMTGYLPYAKSQEEEFKESQPLAVWHNYAHIDMLWDWTTQFGGYNPNRIYDAVPYVHVGIIGNPGFNVMMAGGAGLLNRFHLNNNWLINLDLRATATTARKFGLPSGIAIDVNALIGITYRFEQAGWKNTVDNPYKDVIDELQEANRELAKKRAKAETENEDAKSQREQEHKDLVKLVNAITRDTTFYGIPDTMELTVYYAINSSELSMYEKAHMNTYLRLIQLNDPDNIHMYKVIGTADAGTGAREVNERISRRRADAIKDVLVNNGVNTDNITTEIQIVEGGNVRLSRASHVIIYPVEKPKIVIPDTINLDDEE